MSTTCVYPLEVRAGLPARQARRLRRRRGHGHAATESTQQAEPLLELTAPLRAADPRPIHAPVLLLTHFVWGRDPRVKLARTAELAARSAPTPSSCIRRSAGSRPTPSTSYASCARPRRSSASRSRSRTCSRGRAAGRNLKAYSPGRDPRPHDCDAMTLDFSHASLSGRRQARVRDRLGERLRHVHLCDGSGAIGEGQVFDEHLLPGRGREPVAEVLQSLAARGWDGSIVAEINTRKARTEQRTPRAAARDPRVRPHPHAPDPPPPRHDAIPSRSRGDPPGPPALTDPVEGAAWSG